MREKNPTLHAIGEALLLAILCGATQTGLAGDPSGVNEALRSIKGNWADAQFSVDLTGLSDGAAVLDRAVQVQYEAAHLGYVMALRVSSHGDLVLMPLNAERPDVAGNLSLPIHPPLGRESAVFLFCDHPLNGLLPDETGTASPRTGRARADQLVQKIQTLQAQGVMFAVRRYDYLVDAPAGGTQYTTRSIVREVEQSRPGSTTPRFPTRIEFQFDSDQLTEQSKKDLDVFGAALSAKLHDRKVTLEGHTDAVGTDEYNLDLSQRRAQAARKYLIESFGLSPGQIEASGKGKSGAIASNDTEAERSQNRRVDFVFSAAAAR
jgi:outer membrane protein OmpA-like peptidoglycan-associated protein